MLHFIIVFILYINLLSLYLDKKMSIFFRNMEPLRGLDTPGRFSTILQERQLLRLPDCFPVHQPLLKRVYYKMKEFAPKGSKFFHFIVNTFSEGSKISSDSCLP